MTCIMIETLESKVVWIQSGYAAALVQHYNNLTYQILNEPAIIMW